MKQNIHKIILILLILALLPLPAGADTPATSAGVKILGVAEAEFLNGKVLSNPIETVVPQIFGLTLAQLNLYATVTKGEPFYFAHEVENIGNGTDLVTIKALDVPDGWQARFLVDENKNGFHERDETREIKGELALSEGAVGHFFLEVTAGDYIKTGSVAYLKVHIISSGRDGPAYTGSNGKIYGGDDEAQTTDKAMVL